MGNCCQQFGRLLERIYAAAQNGDWHTCLGSVADALGAEKATMTLTNPHSENISVVAAHGISAADRASYEGYFAFLDPWQAVLADMPMGSTYLSHELFPKGFTAATVIHQQFFNPLGIHSGVGGLFEGGSGFGHVGIYRHYDKGPFSDGDREQIGQLLPHIGRAFQLRATQVEVSGQWHASRSALNQIGVGVIFVNAVGAPTFINHKAKELVSKCHGIKVVDDGVYATRNGEKEAFKALIDGVIASTQGESEHEGGTIRLTCPKSAQPISALVIPLDGIAADRDQHITRSGATIILSSPREHELVSVAVLAELYSLTQAEAELTIGLIQGQTIQDFAKSSGRALNTIRSRMKAVLQKTNTSRQAELVHAILTGPVMMRMR